MIKYIKLKNFFSFKDMKIDLETPVSVLLGINGAGKSNFLKALEFISEGVNGNLQTLILNKWGGFDAMVYKGFENSSKTIELEIGIKADLSRYEFAFPEDIIYRVVVSKMGGFDNYMLSEIIGYKNDLLNYDEQKNKDLLISKNNILLVNKNGVGRVAIGEKYDSYVSRKKMFNPTELALSQAIDADIYKEINAVKLALQSIDIYSFFDTSANGKLRQAVRATGGKKLEKNGGNLPTILNSIKIKSKENYNKITESLKVINPNFKGLDFNILGSGNIELMIDENQLKTSIHVAHMSDGTLKYLCLLAILYNPAHSEIITLEEPESGLHPDMLNEISKAIKEASRNSKIIFTTQSLKLLDNFELENVIVFEKTKENYSIAKNLDESEYKNWYDKFFLGEMWNKGDLGGVRW